MLSALNYFNYNRLIQGTTSVKGHNSLMIVATGVEKYENAEED